MAEERVQKRLTAILAGDVVGDGRLMVADEAGTRARFDSHLRALSSPLWPATTVAVSIALPFKLDSVADEPTPVFW